jgi:hypothetical protein
MGTMINYAIEQRESKGRIKANYPYKYIKAQVTSDIK